MAVYNAARTPLDICNRDLKFQRTPLVPLYIEIKLFLELPCGITSEMFSKGKGADIRKVKKLRFID